MFKIFNKETLSSLVVFVGIGIIVASIIYSPIAIILATMGFIVIDKGLKMIVKCDSFKDK